MANKKNTTVESSENTIKEKKEMSTVNENNVVAANPNGDQKELEPVNSTPDTNQEPTQKDINDAVSGLFQEAFLSLPTFLRVRYLCSVVDKCKDGEESYNKINSLLNTGIKEGDYNIIPEIKCKNDLYQLNDSINTATVNIVPWCKRVCKDCGREYYMYRSEIDFYKNKGFILPKRCKECIKVRKEASNINI